MPTYIITAPDGKEYEVNAPEGATEQEILGYARQNTERQGSSFGRQMGLTARAAGKGLAETVGIVADPIAVGLNAIGANIPRLGYSAEQAMDAIGLPRPQGKAENIIGKGVEMGSGTLAFGGAASLIPKMKSAASHLGSQVAAGVAGGAAGEGAKQYGGGPMSQFGSAMGASLLTPAAVATASPLLSGVVNKTETGIGGLKNLSQRMFGNPVPQQAQNVTVILNNILQEKGIPLGVIGADVMNVLRKDVENALTIGPDLNKDAIRRLVDYRLTGLQPSRGSLTLDPVDVTREKNLAKIGVNSADKNLQSLAQRENANNKAMIDNLNKTGAGQGDLYKAGQKVTGSLKALDNARTGQIGQLYDKARNSAGIGTQIDPARFSQTLFQRLDDEMLGDALPGGVRTVLNQIATGQFPFTIQKAEQIRQAINAQVSGIPSRENAALSLVRKQLDDAIFSSGSAVGDDAANAFATARAAAQNRFKRLENIPGYKAAVEGASPDDFVEKFIIRGKVMDVAKLKSQFKNDGETLASVKDAMAQYLKAKALNWASDEVGNFSQSAFNKAMRDIGDRKLKLFFSPDELARLKALGRVSSYEMLQPRGSAVNNSNSGALVIADFFDKIARSPILNKIPLGGFIGEQVVQPVTTSVLAGPAVNIPRALSNMPVNIPYQLPWSSAPGLLGPFVQ